MMNYKVNPTLQTNDNELKAFRPSSKYNFVFETHQNRDSSFVNLVESFE